jgi:hypothetical protein
MNRRELIATGLIALAAGNSSLANAAADETTVVYLGAKDCSICRAFEMNDKTDFKKRVAAKGMKFREIKVDSLWDIRQASAWPADLKWLLASLGSEKGAPWFFVVQGNSIVSESHSFSSIA